MSTPRRFLQVIAFLCTLVVGVASMVVIVTQTTWFKEWLRGFIVRQAEDYVNGRLSIGRLDGNLFFGVELEDVDVTMQGQKVVELKDVGVNYNALTFISGNVVLDDIRLNKPVLRLVKTADGWNLMQLIKARTPDRPRNRRPIEIGEIGVSDATLYIEGQPVGTSGFDMPDRIERLDASVGVKSDENALTVDINHVSLRTQGPEFGVNKVSGTITRTKDGLTFDRVVLNTEESTVQVSGNVKNTSASAPIVSAHVTSDKLALDEIARLVPALRNYPLQPAFDLTASGPADHLAVNVTAKEQNVGAVQGQLTVNAIAPGRRVAGNMALTHFNVAPIARTEAAKSDISGDVRFDVALPEGKLPLSGTYALDATRASIGGYEARDVKATGRIDDRAIRVDGSANGYGGHATASGVVHIGAPLDLDLAGHATHVDLRNLPPQLKMPGVPSNLQFDYNLSARGPVFSGDVKMDGSTLAGATIAPGTVGTFQFGGGAPAYSAQGSVSQLDIQKVGQGFAIKVLSQDRFKSQVTGTFTMKGSGGGTYPFTLDAKGKVTDSQLFGASVPRLDFTTAFGGGDAHVQAIGTFSGLNPEVITGDHRHAGTLDGAVDVNTTIRQYASGVTVDNFDATGRVNLGRSEIGGVTIDNAVIDGHYANREGELTQFSIAGPDVTATASGPIAFNDTGSSNLATHLESPSLEKIGELIGQPLTGSAIVDATVTGNGQQLKAAGTLKGSNVGSGENKALNLDAQFTASVPQMTLADAAIDAKSHATFLEIAGQKINELTASTTYSKQNLEFDATAKQGARELTASGKALIHTDHQEVHLGSLSFKTQNLVWQTEPGSQAAIQYGKDRVVLENVRLVSGDQHIAADGVVGSTTESLQVRADNVDVAQIDQLLLLDHGMTGRLTANASVKGAVKEPNVDGTFTLKQGTFRQFKFDSLGGKVNYAGSGMNVDVRLQQTPTAWLTAKGYAPMALFRRDEHDATHAGHAHEAALPGEAVDLHVESSRIDLGVVQGFTSYVSNVTGALQANVDVTGSAHDPHMKGAIDIRGGAFKVPDLGTSYTGLDTRIDLAPDRVTVSEMRVLDNHKHVMTVGGSLAVHELSVGGVDIKLQSTDFEVMNNKTGQLKVDTNVTVNGELRAPKVEGTLNIQSSTVNVTDVLERATADPYSTEATALTAPTTPPVPTVFDALDLNVSLSVPNNLVLKGTDIRTANATLGLGDANVTVGGLVGLRKAPGGKLTILGEVNTVRGAYTFRGRRFDIMRDGRLKFMGGDEINPTLDLTARRMISSVETFVHIRGTVKEPELTFTSNPPLEEADILSLIIFNQPVNELGEGQQVSLAEQATSLAGGYLAGGLARSISEALPFEEFEIQPVTSAQGGLGGSVLIGQRVGDRAFVKLRQGFGSDQSTEFLLEYQIKDYLRLETTVAENAGGTQRAMFHRVERGGIDLIFFFSY